MAAKQAAPAAAKIIKYIGIRTNNFGRPLWEIVLNLKQLGIGRYVTRTSLQRYPEPTFYKILSVKPYRVEYPITKESTTGDLWVEETYRGRKVDAPLNLGRTAWKDDYQLVHKHEEDSLLDGKPRLLESKHILPRTAPLPPLWKEIIRRERIAQGVPPEHLNEPEPEVEMIYINLKNSFSNRRIAQPGETPSFQTGPGNFSTNNSPMYDDVIWDREEAVKKYSNLKPIYPTKGHDKFQLPEVDN